MTTIRFAGAQIPVTPYTQTNVMEIRRAIDWAAENRVDYLVTPEASLSGYTKDFHNNHNRIIDALLEIEKYAANKHVGLCLGTLWDELDGIRRNQIRFYNPEGIFLGVVNKHFQIEYDTEVGDLGDSRKYLIALPINDKIIPIGGLICVDMYGVPDQPSIPYISKNLGATVLIHSTNGIRNIKPTNGLSTELSDQIANDWHDINLRRASFLRRTPILTVDNCYMFDGTEYYGNTSSESGVLIDGEWVTKVPRSGTQYFYYDLPLTNIAIDMPDFFKST